MRLLRDLPTEEANFIESSSGMSGFEAAKELMAGSRAAGVAIFCGFYDINCYDPRIRAIRLSARVFHSHSLLSVAFAAHEVAHAMQHFSRYLPFTLRLRLLPIARAAAFVFASILLWSLVTGHWPLLSIALSGFVLLALFHSLALLIEFDASKKAENLLWNCNIISEESERAVVHRLLRRAAFSYVFSFLLAPINLFKIIFSKPAT